jgi:aminoglycoside phosphotransferase family enzyme/predicted kinase
MSDTLHRLVSALQQPRLFPHPVSRFQVIETHISVILLTGGYAYKFKKPVNFGFLDFSTLEKRRHYCLEELRLNRRLAPDLYEDVVAVCAGPCFCSAGEAIEYALRMREFDQHAQFDHLLDLEQLTPAHLDALAQRVADFHADAAVSGPATPFGMPPAVQGPMLENFEHILSLLTDPPARARLAPLQQWVQQADVRLQPVLLQRKRDGFIRECHGDLHLRNVALVEGEPMAFDCIEFNDNLRWIDVISDVAFMVMDLDYREQAALGSGFLNAWLERSGDYAGLVLLRYYQVYRAMVRAKVDCLRAHQPDLPAAEYAEVMAEYHAYIALAQRYTQPARPALLLMHGLSGSGKTTVSRFLLEQLPAIRIRSDVERKRLHGLAAEARTGSAVAQGIYDRAAGIETYARLQQLATAILEAGHTAIVDAAFLQADQRAPFIALAGRLGVPCFIIDCQAPEAELRQRILARARAQRDASEAGIAVLEHQLREYRPVDPDQGDAIVMVTASDAAARDRLLEDLRSRG